MLIILVQDDGKTFQVRTQKGEDITEEFECNMVTVKTKDGRFVGGFHIGQDITEQVLEGAVDDPDPQGDRYIGDGRG